MLTLIVKWLIYALAIFLVGSFLPGLHVPDYTAALWIALILGILNVTLRPLLQLIALPVTIITLGLFALVVNGFVLWLADKFSESITIDGFWWAVIAAVIISLVSAIGNRFILGKDGKLGGN